MCGKVNIWLWLIRDAETFDGDDVDDDCCCCCGELDGLPVDWLEFGLLDEDVQGGEESVAVGNELNALVSAV